MKKLGALLAVTALAACSSNAGTRSRPAQELNRNGPQRSPSAAAATNSRFCPPLRRAAPAAGRRFASSPCAPFSAALIPTARPSRTAAARSRPNRKCTSYSGASSGARIPTACKHCCTAWGQTMGGSKWFNTVTQYYQISSGKKHLSRTPRISALTWADTSSSPNSSPTDARGASRSLVAAEALRRHVGVDASYVIALPTGSDPNGFGYAVVRLSRRHQFRQHRLHQPALHAGCRRELRRGYCQQPGHR